MKSLNVSETSTYYSGIAIFPRVSVLLQNFLYITISHRRNKWSTEKLINWGKESKSSKQNSQLSFYHITTDLITGAKKPFSKLTLRWCTFNWTEYSQPFTSWPTQSTLRCGGSSPIHHYLRNQFIQSFSCLASLSAYSETNFFVPTVDLRVLISEHLESSSTFQCKLFHYELIPT